MKLRAVLLATTLLAASPAAAQDRLFADVFQDHAVLQRGKPIPVWGQAAAGAPVTVTLGETSTETRADGEGRWHVSLTPPATGGPYALSARVADRTETLSDILIGDVWLCSGQSNMEFGLRQVTNADTEVAASADPQLRLLHVARNSLPSPTDRLPANSVWKAASPESTPHFSAACYFMGRHLRQTQQVPIGLISSSWGGSIIEDWLSADSLLKAGDYRESLDILAAYERSPEEAQRLWNTSVDRWWRAADPSLKTRPDWTEAAFDDSAWPSVKPEGAWEAVPDMATFDGTALYRTAVTLTAAQARGAARLELGPIDDVDVVFVNGRRVGGAQGWDTPRVYTLEPGVLRPGRNVIAVGVLDTGGGGGMWGPADKKLITAADGSVISLAAPWRLKPSATLADLPPPPRAPWIGGSGTTTLYNGMIAPFGDYGLTGFAWYQGESNVGDPVGYSRLLPGLMADWRRAFDAPEAPFLVVQLANYGPASAVAQPSGWAGLREVQRRTVEADPRAGLAVAIDIGDRYDIHPTNKQEVGRRLALEARRLAHGDTTAARSPSPASARRDGDVVRVGFDRIGTGLITLSSAQAVGFELCATATGCRFVSGAVQGSDVVLPIGQGAAPSLVRFCWSESPVCNLYGPDGLPAVPFEIGIQ
ncbi:sialate O-acetylesterase [Brevundimonas sp. Root1279]|uniref:sialate O-acetylesterase n=1 Tax=Brevundimonas sp. Root1279 TaxID=1736443 RepID=UPI0009E7374D|nr:sialate O-acetylesterase [Brevundimonas sp. Root1279]